MAGTSDIAIIGLVALMLSDKLGGLNLGGLFGSGTPADPKVEVRTTESITCTCADGFTMQSDSGDCIQSCESAGHGTKTTITEGETTVRIKETEIVHDPVITNVSMTTTCPDGEVIDLTNVPNDEWAQVITNRCGYDCPEPYEFVNGRCTLPTAVIIPPPPTQPHPQGEYEEISGGRTWRDSPELQAVQAPAFLQNEPDTPPHTPPEINVNVAEIYRTVGSSFKHSGPTGWRDDDYGLDQYRGMKYYT
jgi:hypothetical protein